MRVVPCENYELLSVQAAARVMAEIERRRDLLLCPATGGSPTGLYRELAKRAESNPDLFRSLRVVALDEWGDLKETDPGSTTGYLKERLLGPLRIPLDRFTGWDTDLKGSAACGKMQEQLTRLGPIDVCILGLGINGHIGFNEPRQFMMPHCHIAYLSEETLRHAMARAMEHPPSFGFTLGLSEILASRYILLLVTGEGKRFVTGRLLGGDVTTVLPASFLWLHGNVDCLVDQALL